MSQHGHSLSRLELWLDDLSDRLNPFVVREVRSWLKSRWLPITLLLQLAVTWCFTVAIAFRTESLSDTAGYELFAVLRLLTTATTTIPIPFYLAMNLAREVRGDCLEALWMTPNSGRRMAAGKLLCSLLSYALHLSVFVPFLTSAVLFGGVGVLDVLLFLLANSLTMLWLCFGAMTLGALARNLFVVVIASPAIGLPAFLIVVAFVSPQDNDYLGVAFTLTVLLLFAAPLGWAVTQQMISPFFGHVQGFKYHERPSLCRIVKQIEHLADLLRKASSLPPQPKEWSEHMTLVEIQRSVVRLCDLFYLRGNGQYGRSCLSEPDLLPALHRVESEFFGFLCEIECTDRRHYLPTRIFLPEKNLMRFLQKFDAALIDRLQSSARELGSLCGQSAKSPPTTADVNGSVYCRSQ